MNRMPPSWVTDYTGELRADADRRAALWPGDPLANALPIIADEIEGRAQKHEMQALTLEQASGESGFSYGHLQRLVSEGEIPNAGEPGAPRVLRGDLPRKGGRRPSFCAQDGGIADEILARRAR